MMTGDVIVCGVEGLCAVVRMNDCSAKCVRLGNRDWQAKDFTIDEAEPGFLISAQTEYGGVVKLIGGIDYHKIKRVKSAPVDLRTKEERILGYDYLPMPGTAPTKKEQEKALKVEAAKVAKSLETVIEDDGVAELQRPTEPVFMKQFMAAAVRFREIVYHRHLDPPCL